MLILSTQFALSSKNHIYPKTQFILNELTLSLNTQITDIQEDSLGFKWITTLDGLVKFDGQKTKTIQCSYPTGKNFIRILTCTDKNLWLLTYNGGLCYIKDDRLINYRYNKIFNKHLNAGNVDFFNVERNGDLYFSIKGSGIYRINEFGIVDTIIDSSFKNYTGIILFRTPDGIDITTKIYHKLISEPSPVIKLYKWEKGIFKIIDTLSNIIHRDLTFNIQTVRIDSKNLLIVLGCEKLLRINNEHVNYCKLPIPIREAFVSKSGEIWLSGRDHGIFRMNKSTKTIRLEEVYAFKDIFGLLRHEGNDGTKWIITKYQGVGLIPNTSMEYLKIPQSKSGHENIRSITLHNDTIYLAGRNHFSFIQPQLHYQKKLTQIHLHSGDSIRWKYNNCTMSMCSDGHKLMASGYYGIGIQSNNTIKLVKSKSDLPSYNHTYGHAQGYKSIAIMNGQKNSFLGVTRDYIYLVKNDFISEHTMIDRDQYIDAAYFSDSLIFISKKTGLYKTQINFFNRLESISVDQKHQYKFIIELEHKLLCVTNSNQIIVLDPYSLNQMTKKIDLPGEIYTVSKVSDENSVNKLIFTGEFGIAEYSMINLNPQLKLYPVDLPNHYKGKGKIIQYKSDYYLAAKKGVVIIKKDDLKGLSLHPDFVFSHIETNGLEHDIDEKKPISLTYLENNLLIEVSVFNYVFPNRKGKIRYRLGNSNWVELADPIINLINLNPNIYKLEVQAKYTGLPWGKSQIISFEISPPFWKTWWFYSISGLICVIGIYIIVQYHFRIKQRELWLSLEKATSEQKALRAQLNPHFLFNSLNSAIWLINKGKKQEATQFIEELSNMFREILHSSTHSTNDIKSEFELYKRYLTLERFRLDEKFHFTLNLDEKLKRENPIMPSLLLQPIIENAIKHGVQYLENGIVEVSAIKTKKGFKLIVYDNGTGDVKTMDPKNSTSYGIKLTTERLKVFEKLQEMRTSITFDKTYHDHRQGTLVTINIVNF